MKVHYRILLGVLIATAAVLLFRLLIGGSTVALFAPAGTVASQESGAIKLSVLLMLLIVVPMFILLFAFAWKYREGNRNAKYEPVRARSVWGQLVLWLIPAVLVAVLAVLNWDSAHAVDPYQPIRSSAPPITIQVVALAWKWLFIYPQQNIATVNYVEFPENVPVHFDLTADAPMSSFWIPQLGSQIYAMNAMMTQLNLIASTTGQYTGKDTEINGEGYAGMTFTAKSVSLNDFNNWVVQVQRSTSTLDVASYNALAAPSEYDPPAYYSSVASGLFGNIMMKYMMPTSTSTDMEEPGFVATTTGTPTSAAPSTTSTPSIPAMPGMEM
jgi:cytochrome o ubiquinol oxidase subunit II